MHSLKNTFVAITLLVISFGLYQVSLTPDVEIDPADTPAVEISDGSDELASRDADAATSIQMPNLTANPPLPASSGFPDFPEINVTQPDSLSENAPIERQPLVASSSNNVQTIEYPNSLPEQTLPATNQNLPEIAQRKLIEPSNDQGLIDALQSQQEFESAMQSAEAFPPTSEFTEPPSTPAPNDFGDMANNPNSLPANSATTSSEFAPMGDGFQANNASPNNGEQSSAAQSQFSPEPGSTQYEAQSIASSDSTFNELASNVNTPGAEANSFETGIAQANREPDLSELDFNAAWPKVDQLVEAGEFHDALKLLSRFYRDDQLSGPQRQRLLGWLDALAGKVIFSNEHHLASQPYVVRSNESLTDIANQWNVPAQLIYNVNRNSVSNPAMVEPGTELKIIPGPFSAEINLSAKVMTLFLGDLYAGRFPIKVGISGAPRPGDFKIIVKSEIGHTCAISTAWTTRLVPPRTDTAPIGWD